MIVYNSNNKIVLDIKVDDTSYRYRSIRKENSVTLYYSLPEFVEIPVGSYINFQGERYTLWLPENFTRKGQRIIEYTVTFGSYQEFLKRVKYKNLSIKPAELKFILWAEPIMFLNLIVENLNEADPSKGWKVGSYLEATRKNLSFNHEYCYDVLQKLADEYNTEWEIEGKVIHFKKVEKFKDSPLPLSYGQGNGFLPGTGRANKGNAPITKLYVQGGDRNIDFSKYGSKTLLLPKSKELTYEGKRYKTDADGTYIVRADKELASISEDSFDASHIYPSRVGTVTAVTVADKEKHLYQFSDSTIPNDLNFEDNLIEGETMTVIFQSGALVGREFDVKYTHASRLFEIVPEVFDGFELPSDSLKPSEGGDGKAADTYAVFNISLPDSYVCNNATQEGASWDMFREAVRYFYENEDGQFSFSGDLDGIWARNKWYEMGGRIIPGGYVLFSDEQFQKEGILIRITGVKDYINDPHSPQIELSNVTAGGSLSGELGKIEANEVINDNNYRGSMRYTDRRYRDSKESLLMLADAVDGFSEAINPITVQTMAMLVGDERLQFRFVSSKNNPKEITLYAIYDQETKTFSIQKTILQHMTLGVDTMSSSHKANEYKFWDMAAYAPLAIDTPKAMYLYAKCQKTGTDGNFLLSEKSYNMDGEDGFFYFLTGTLSSEYEGKRSFVTLYGFTEILPGRITVPLIVSPDGKTYFNIAEGEIGGKITFTNGSSGLENIEEWPAAQEEIEKAQSTADSAIREIGETNQALTGFEETVNTTFKDGIIEASEAKAIEKYINMLNTEKADADAVYNQLSANTYLAGTAKTNLTNSKTAYNTAHTNLIKAVNDAIADGKTTVAEKNNVDSKFTLYRTALSDYSTKVEAANKAIQDAIKKYADTASQQAEAAQTTANNAIREIGETNQALTGFETTVNTTFKDGIIETSEAKAIEKYINMLNSEKADADAVYNQLYANTYLTGTAKTNLASSKTAYNTAHTNLISAVNSAIADGKTTVAEKNNVDSKFALYRTALSDYSTKIEAANKAIQDALKKYADTASQLAQAAQTTANNAIREIEETNQALTGFETTVNTTFKDGIIETSEAKAIEKYINMLNSEKADADAVYNQLYANAYLTGTAKTNLANSKTAYNTAHTNLISAVNSAIADGKTTVAEKNNVDSKFALYRTALSDYSTKVEAANKAIQDALKGYSDTALAKANEAQSAANNAQASANSANIAVGSLNTYVDGAFADGIISEAEAKAIEKYINTVNSEKLAVQATFERLYENTYLSAYYASMLHQAHENFKTATTNLTSAINTAISDGKVTASEKNNVNSKFSSFNLALASFNGAVGNANKAIQDTLNSRADSTANSYMTQARNDLAKNLGYSSYSALVDYATQGKTIINGGYIRTTLLDAVAIVAQGIAAQTITTGKLNVTSGAKIAGWNVSGNKLIAQSGGAYLDGATGEVDITGKFTANSSGNRVVIDPANRGIRLINSSNQTVAHFDLAGSLATLQVFQFNTSGVRAYGTTITPGIIEVHGSGTSPVVTIASYGLNIDPSLIPTSSSGRAKGTIWRDGDTLKIKTS